MIDASPVIQAISHSVLYAMGLSVVFFGSSITFSRASRARHSIDRVPSDIGDCPVPYSVYL